MNRLFIIGALIGLGIGIFKLVKKSGKTDGMEPNTTEPMPA